MSKSLGAGCSLFLEPCFSGSRMGGGFSLAISGLRDGGEGGHSDQTGPPERYSRVSMQESQARTKAGRGQKRNRASGNMRVRLQAAGKPGLGPLGSEATAKAGIKPEQKKIGLLPDGQRLVGHRDIRPRGDESQAWEQTHVTWESEGRESRVPVAPGCGRRGRTPSPPRAAAASLT